jgi:membrane protein DedA with SNARE-associated domain
LVRPHHLEKAESWFDRRGEVTVFFTRMMPGVRTFISLPAGIAKMNVAKFLGYSLLGSVPWNVALAYLGWGAGKAAGDNAWENLQVQFSRYNHYFYLALGVFVIAVVAYGLVRWRRRRHGRWAARAEEDDGRASNGGEPVNPSESDWSE